MCVVTSHSGGFTKKIYASLLGLSGPIQGRALSLYLKLSSIHDDRIVDEIKALKLRGEAVETVCVCDVG